MSGKLPHVLVVDDEKTIADTLALILKMAGYSTAVAYSGSQAIAQSRLHPPDMLISDVIMPGMNGFQLAVLMKEALPQCAVLLVSGQATAARLVDVSNVSGLYMEVMAKPVPPAEIIDRIRRLCPIGPGDQASA
jgi:DNA-binding response OmpR family regulator